MNVFLFSMSGFDQRRKKSLDFHFIVLGALSALSSLEDAIEDEGQLANAERFGCHDWAGNGSSVQPDILGVQFTSEELEVEEFQQLIHCWRLYFKNKGFALSETYSLDRSEGLPLLDVGGVDLTRHPDPESLIVQAIRAREGI